MVRAPGWVLEKWKIRYENRMMAIRQINFFINLALAVLIVLAHSAGIKESAAAALGIEGHNTVVDQAGRSLVIDRPFDRIISLYGAHTENLFNLGLDDEIIGVSRHETYPPRALKKPVFSYREDPEKFLAARPDLVIIRPMIDRGYPQFVSRLEKNGIAVLSLQPQNVADMFVYWQILGLVGGKQQRALKMISQFETAVSDFKALTDGKTTRKRVYFEAIHSKMKTFSPDSMAVFALETAGGVNVASDAKAVRNTNIAYYGKERILSHGRRIDVYLVVEDGDGLGAVKGELSCEQTVEQDRDRVEISAPVDLFVTAALLGGDVLGGAEVGPSPRERA